MPGNIMTPTLQPVATQPLSNSFHGGFQPNMRPQQHFQPPVNQFNPQQMVPQQQMNPQQMVQNNGANGLNQGDQNNQMMQKAPAVSLFCFKKISNNLNLKFYILDK